MVIDVLRNGTATWRSQVSGSDGVRMYTPSIIGFRKLSEDKLRLLVEGGLDQMCPATAPSLRSLVDNSHDAIFGFPRKDIREQSEGGLRLLGVGGSGSFTGTDSVEVIDVVANGTAIWRSQLNNTDDTPLEDPNIKYIREQPEGGLQLLIDGDHHLMVIDVSGNGTVTWCTQMASSADTPLDNPDIRGVRVLPEEGGLRLFVTSRFNGGNVIVIDLKSEEDPTFPQAHRQP